MLRNWFCTAVIVGATALTLLTPDTGFAQRRGGGGGRGGRGGWEGRGERGREGRWDGGWGWGLGWGGPGYGGYYGGYNGPYISADAYGSPTTTSDSFYYNPGSTPDVGYGQQGNVARVMVRVPSPDARVEFGDNQTQQTGTTRTFVSPPLEPGYKYTYHITARWKDNGGREIVRERNVKVQPGQQVTVDFSQPLQQSDNLGQPDKIRGGERILENRDRTDQIDRDRQPQRDRDRQPQQDRDRQTQPDRNRQPEQSQPDR
jgi:uncharacterized protein (TIGR03000 family)